MLKNKLTMIAVILTLSISLSACTSILDSEIQSHGYTPSAQDIKYIKQNNLSKINISQQYGKPFVIGVYNKNYWYYISYRTSQYGFTEKQYIDFNVVEIKFNNDSIENIITYDQTNLQKIAFNKNKSKTSGKKLGILEQVIGNVGKFRTKQK